MAALAALLALAGCADAHLTPIGEGGAAFSPDPDERALWDAAGREAEAIARAAPPRADAAIEARLTAMAQRLMGEGALAAGAPRPIVAVLMDPALDAFALPIGRIYVSSGAVARVRNEDQLAAIVAREVAHVRLRHALAVLREGRPIDAGPSAPRPGVGLAGLPLAHLAAVEGYGESREHAADADAVESLARAGYDAREAPRAFEVLGAPSGARVHAARDAPGVERFALGDPTWTAGRARSLRRLTEREPSASAPPAADATGDFARLTLPLVRDNARLDARAGRPHLARAQIDRVLAAAPDDPIARLCEGDVLRLEAQRERPPDRPALLDQARRAYERAAALDPAWAEPYRALGLLAYQAGDGAGARAAFERYLAVRPDGPDAQRVREYLIELAPR